MIQQIFHVDEPVFRETVTLWQTENTSLSYHNSQEEILRLSRDVLCYQLSKIWHFCLEVRLPNELNMSLSHKVGSFLTKCLCRHEGCNAVVTGALI